MKTSAVSRSLSKEAKEGTGAHLRMWGTEGRFSYLHTHLSRVRCKPAGAGFCFSEIHISAFNFFGKGFSTSAHKRCWCPFFLQAGLALVGRGTLGKKIVRSPIDHPATKASKLRLRQESSTTDSLSFNFSRQRDQRIFEMSTAELATSYAALILADDGVEITVRFQQSPLLPTPMLRPTT